MGEGAGLQMINWKGPSDWTYFFYTEDGYQELTYQEYLGEFPNSLRESHLMHSLKDRANRENLFLGRTILSYDKKWLACHRKEREMFRMLQVEQVENPLQFFCPNGQSQLDFLNERDKYSVSGMVAPNRCGKSTIGWIAMMLDLYPCDPAWKIFTDHGVKWKPYAPPLDGYTAAVCSYELVNLKGTIWPQVIRKWTPKSFLGEYAQGVGKGGRTINWKDSPRIQNDVMNLWLMYYSMSQTPYESQALDRIQWDEQPDEAKFDGADERLRTRNGKHYFTLTPHKVEGYPETGAGTFIHDMDLKNTTKGHKVKFFKCSLLDDVPDWIYPEMQKVAAYTKWVTEPEKNHHVKVIKEGRARLYGEWHETGGMVYDEWDRTIHLVDPFDIPREWTRYRSMDWGRVNPTACLFAAVNPDGDLYIYDMYYKENALVSESAEAIVRQSGNLREKVGIVRDERTGSMLERWQEIQKVRFAKTILDGRTFASKEPNSTITIGKLFKIHGLDVKGACLDDTYSTIPVVKEWLRPDYEKVHPQTGRNGKPRVFIFRTLSLFIKHIEHYVNQPVNRKNRDGSFFKAERPRAVDDHDLDALRYLIMDNPRYIYGFNEVDSDKDVRYTRKTRQEGYDKFTGY
jgi:hypothetical protein